MASSFSIRADPGTDIWRKPPTTDVFNAPRAAHSRSKTTAPLSHFRSARLTFRLPARHQYDQAGILLSLRSRGATHPFSSRGPPKWLKTGVEYYDGVPRAATVACDSWADWSLAPVSGDGEWVTVLLESGGDASGTSLWVYQVVGQEKVPLREVCWVFGKEPANWDVEVEAYACRPAKEAGEELVVDFKDFEVEWTQ